MLGLVAIEMLPTAVRGGRLGAAVGILGGAGAMLAFSLALGV
jgi:TctA family transporter